MVFDFTDSIDEQINDSFSAMLAMQKCIREYLRTIGKYNLFFKLKDTDCSPADMYEFELIGKYQDILDWCTKEFCEFDQADVIEKMKLYG